MIEELNAQEVSDLAETESLKEQALARIKPSNNQHLARASTSAAFESISRSISADAAGKRAILEERKADVMKADEETWIEMSKSHKTALKKTRAAAKFGLGKINDWFQTAFGAIEAVPSERI